MEKLCDGVTFWNLLPDSLHDPMLSSDRFRKLLKTNLFQHYHWVHTVTLRWRIQGRGGRGNCPPSDKIDFSPIFSKIYIFLPSQTLKPVLPFQRINCNALSIPVMKCMKKCCLYSLSQYFLVLASEALEKGRKT